LEENKKIAKCLLELSTDNNFIVEEESKLILSRIETITDLDISQIIVILLTRSYYFTDTITNETIDNKINKTKEINELIFNKKETSESLSDINQ